MILRCVHDGKILVTTSKNPRCSKCQRSDFDEVNPEETTLSAALGTTTTTPKQPEPASLARLDKQIEDHFARLSRIQIMNAMAGGQQPQAQQQTAPNDKMYDFMKSQNERMFDILENNIEEGVGEAMDDNPENMMMNAFLQGMKNNPKQAQAQIHDNKDAIAGYIKTHPEDAQKIQKQYPELAKIILQELKG